MRFFQLVLKSTEELATLHSVDERLCAKFGVPCDEQAWYMGWFGILGRMLSTGASFADCERELRELAASASSYDEEELYAALASIAASLDEDYVVDSWEEA